jgi:formylglycine-generating enzyme required for sulfatase activity
MGGCFIVRGVASAWLVSGGESNPPEGDGSRVSRKELFISYSHKDRAFLEQFWTHIRPLEEDYGLQRWDDSRMRPGDIWLKEIEQALKRAQVALLLVSPDFLASDFIRRKELPALFEAAEKNGLTILWLPIRPCSWKRHRQIEQYQSVGSLDPTLAEMDEVKRDREMVKITDHIHELFERVQNERHAAQQAAAVEALAQRQEAALRLAEQDAQRQREETARLERLKAEHEARAEAERWRAEAERLAEEAEQLAREKEELQRQVLIPNAEVHPPTAKIAASNPARPLPIQIHTTCCWLVREGKKWRKQDGAFTVPGYKEELAEGVVITMVQIPEGEFLMGSPPSEEGRSGDEGPQHRVRLPRFFMDQTPVTQAQWQVVAGWSKQECELTPDPSRFKGSNRPVDAVSWSDAIEFCMRLSQRSGKKYTLPSEAQWEYACRACTTTPFHFGETISAELANYNATEMYGNGFMGVHLQCTTDVASFPRQSLGSSRHARQCVGMVRRPLA